MTAGALDRSHWVYSEVLPQFQQWLQAESGEECPEIVEKIIYRTKSPMAEGHYRYTIVSTVAEVVGAHAEC